MANKKIGEVFLTKTTDRDSGIRGLMSRFDLREFSGKRVALKANFNSADPFPASTHLDTLRAIVANLKSMGAEKMTLGERSGMGNTRDVLEALGVFSLAKELGFEVNVLNESAKEDWKKVGKEGTHWLRGFYIAKLFSAADKVVQTCCLKTHRFGGHFTLSLKNSVGLVAKKIPGGLYDYMWELHGSPQQRQMIAEINSQYKTDLVVMDGLKAYVDGGPEGGREVDPNLLLASTDRVAIDAVGVAILRSYGSTSNVMKGRIFDLDQLRRAATLEIGVKSASEIEVTPINEDSRQAAQKIMDMLKKEG
jgi:uncharacterized protein (DUF362 family)